MILTDKGQDRVFTVETNGAHRVFTFVGRFMLAVQTHSHYFCLIT